ncbi:hypothetical protein EYF80_044981 [Liparis tanakae]|uniref:Uncharacterized protein n=1 Tax=Liparis tanakae TaxID=230148 RepID=A0A4Z2FWX0_9TELE|nr:hypothetical protein EYF80_044981 [Liparis tanakae]
MEEFTSRMNTHGTFSGHGGLIKVSGKTGLMAKHCGFHRPREETPLRLAATRLGPRGPRGESRNPRGLEN